MADPFLEARSALAASALGADATWISKAGGPGVSLRVVPSQPAAAFDLGESRGVAFASECFIAGDALTGPPVKGDLIAFLDQGFVVERVEPDNRRAGFTLYLRRQ